MAKKETVETAVVTKETKVESKRGLATRPTGQLKLGSVEEQFAFAQRLIELKMISETFTAPAQVVIGIQWAISMRLEPVTALNLMYVIRGRPSLWGDGPLMMCQRNGELCDIEEFFVDKDGKRISVENKNLSAPAWGAVCRVWRKGHVVPQEDFFSLEDMRRAKVDVNKHGKKETWAKYERIMLRYRARSLALKTKFADCLQGVDIAEYHHNFTPELPEESHIAGMDTKENINAALLEDFK